MKDQISLFRFNNQVKILRKAQAKCEKHNITPKAISLKLLCPLLDYAALEEDDEMQDKWANLLTNMVDSKQNFQNHIFPVILSQISMDEFDFTKKSVEKSRKNIRSARLEHLYKEIGERVIDGEASETNEGSLRLGISKEEFARWMEFYIEPNILDRNEVKDLNQSQRQNLVRLGLMNILPHSEGQMDTEENVLTMLVTKKPSDERPKGAVEIRHDFFEYAITEFAAEFIEACEIAAENQEKKAG